MREISNLHLFMPFPPLAISSSDPIARTVLEAAIVDYSSTCGVYDVSPLTN